MSSSIEHLAWDTEFFGVSIARVDLDGVGPDELATIEAASRTEGVVCLYGSLDPADAQATVRVQEHGFRFMEASTTFSLRLDEPQIAAPAGITLRHATVDDLEVLQPAADALAGWSRFAVDPRFGLAAARRLQAAFLERAVRCETGEHELVLAELDGEVVAFVTRRSLPQPQVDGVWTCVPGSGAARYLMEDARRWAGDRALVVGAIAARNISGLRWASHCGCRVTTVRYHYHRWFDEPGRELP